MNTVNLFHKDFFEEAPKIAKRGFFFDALITDPPYSARTHKGYDEGMPNSLTGRSELGYAAFDDDRCREFVDLCAPIVRGWIVIMCSHDQIPVYEDALRAHGLYVFAPVGFLGIGKGPRITGDGPASWMTWLLMARPKTAPWSKWGSLPGAYVQPAGLPTEESKKFHTGGKCLWLMKKLLSDYTRPGQHVLDPCAGAATTAAACRAMDRSCTTYEVDPDTYKKAKARLEMGVTAEMFT